MSIPKEPRQQMINIMYLVLIALLALSVSAEILNAFKIVNRGITNSNSAIQGQIDATLLAFEEKLKKDESGQKYYVSAQKAGEVSADFLKYIDELELLLKTESGVDPETGELQKQDDQDTPSRILLGQEKKAYELEQKILATREEYLNLFRNMRGENLKADIEYLDKAMPLNAPPPDEKDEKKDWATYNFYQMPVIGAITLLNQYRNDAVASEAMVVQRFSEKVGGVQRKIVFDNMKAAAIPSSKSVEEGDQYSVEIFLAATSAKERPTITAGGQNLALKPDGSAVYKTVASGVGRKTLSGSIAVPDGTGGVKNIPFSTQYEVTPKLDIPVPDNSADPKDQKIKQLMQQLEQVKKELQQTQQTKPKVVTTTKERDPTGVVSPTKMNVFYIGVDNPIDVSVSGASLDDVKATMTTGTLTPAGRGKYTVRVPNPAGRTTNVNLTVGGSQISSNKFRIKRIPDPIPEVGGKSGGVMRTGEMKAQMGVIARLKDFDFDARFDVLGFEMTVAERGQDLLIVTNSGPKFNDQSQKLLNRAKVGSIYYFDNIKVKGPDKTTRKLPTISFKIR